MPDETSKDVLNTLNRIYSDPVERFHDLLEIAGLNLETDLVGSDLSEIDFSLEDLSKADFSKCDLSKCNFAATRLVGALMCSADLEFAVFRNADLTLANFDSANLNGADFTNANLAGASFRDVDLSGIHFDEDVSEKVKSREATSAEAGSVHSLEVPYRETISDETTTESVFKKQMGGAGQFARVKVIFEPGQPGSGIVFKSAITGGSIPREFIPSVEAGIRKAAVEGPLGFPAVDFVATLVDGLSHDVDSSALAFETAGRIAFREGAGSARPRLLEPIMQLDVLAPAANENEVVADIESRRGKIEEIGTSGRLVMVKAKVPLANMTGYEQFLRSLTAEEASFRMRYDSYEFVPSRLQNDIIADSAQSA